MAEKKKARKEIVAKASRNKGGKCTASDKVSRVKEEAVFLAKLETDSGQRPAAGRSVILDHRLLWQDVRERFLDGLKSGDEAKLKAAKLAGDGLLNIVKGERQAWGLMKDEAEPSEDELRATVEALDDVTAPS